MNEQLPGWDDDYLDDLAAMMASLERYADERDQALSEQQEEQPRLFLSEQQEEQPRLFDPDDVGR